MRIEEGLGDRFPFLWWLGSWFRPWYWCFYIFIITWWQIKVLLLYWYRMCGAHKNQGFYVCFWIQISVLYQWNPSVGFITFEQAVNWCLITGITPTNEVKKHGCKLVAWCLIQLGPNLNPMSRVWYATSRAQDHQGSNGLRYYEDGPITS